MGSHSEGTERSDIDRASMDNVDRRRDQPPDRTAQRPTCPPATTGTARRRVAEYSADKIKVLEGLEAVRKRPGHVHRVDRAGRAAPSRLRGRRQLDRRSAGRILRSGQRHDSHRRVGDGRRQRPRHPGRSARERQVRCRSRADGAPRRRQVRQRQLQGVRRAARRRRVGRERAVRNARRRDLAQRRRSTSRATSAARPTGDARDDRHDQAPRHQGHVQARSRRCSRRRSSASTSSRSGCASWRS